MNTSIPAPPSTQKSTGIFWFSNDLRVANNSALQSAATECDRLLCVYVIDSAWLQPSAFGTVRLGLLRWKFLCQSLQDLSTQLQNHQQQLIVRVGDPLTEMAQLLTVSNASHIFRSVNAGAIENDQWQTLQQRFPHKTFRTRHTHTLFTPDILPFAVAELPNSFSKFRRVIEKACLLPEAEELDSYRFESNHIDWPPLPHSTAFNGLHTLDIMDLVNHYPNNTERDSRPSVDTTTSANPWQGGASSAHAHCQRYFGSHAPSHYKHTRNGLDTALNGWAYSTQLSSWLAMGCLSPVDVVAYVRRYESQQGANESTYWILFELLWREYFQWYSHRYGAQLFGFSGIKTTAPLTSFYPHRWQMWCNGNTPYPIVNACMHQLNDTGYMSNRGRQLVASCLVHELELDWRYGASYFEQQLIDYDVASNWGNWQYLAGVGADPRGHRRFDLAKQTALYDPSGDFVQRWCGSDDAPPVTALHTVDAADWPLPSN